MANTSVSTINVEKLSLQFAPLEHSLDYWKQSSSNLSSLESAGELLEKKPAWTRDRESAGVVLYVCEGSLSDQIIGLRFVKNLAQNYGEKIIVVCDEALAPLAQRIDEVGGVLIPKAGKSFRLDGSFDVYHTHWLNSTSAVQALGLEVGDLSGKAYLQADPERVQFWQQWMNGKWNGQSLKVGLNWTLETAVGNFSTDNFRTLLGHPTVQFFSFHPTNLANVTDLSPQLANLDEAAAAMMQLDLLISNSSELAHLNAAMGLLTWVVAPAFPIAATSKNSPWYRKVKVFRPKQNDTGSEIEIDLKSSLQKWVNDRTTSSRRLKINRGEVHV